MVMSSYSITCGASLRPLVPFVFRYGLSRLHWLWVVHVVP
jgi:hypothetical protein